MNHSDKTMEKIVALCKNRGFVYAGSEISPPPPLMESTSAARNTNGNTIKNILPVATMRTPPAERFGAFLRLL